MIPVLETPEGEFIQDTTAIIDSLEKRFPERSVYPATPKRRLVALLMELYADEWLLIPAMHFRWSFPRINRKFIYGEFGKVVSPMLPGPIRRMAGKRLARRFPACCRCWALPTAPRTPLRTGTARCWTSSTPHFSQYPYLLGTAPSVGDFALMAPMFAHLYRDPAPGRIMQRRAPTW